MAESDHFSEIQEESPYQTPNGHLAAEEESPFQAPNSHLAAEEESPYQAPNGHLAAEEESPFQAPNGHLAAEEESPYQTPNGHLAAEEEPPYQAPNSHLAAGEEPPHQAPNSHPAAGEEPPHQAPNSHPAAGEEPPLQAPNSHLAAEEEQRTNPKLLRAIVNGDLMLFESILIEGEPRDIESIRESIGGNNGLRGVAYGENTALHVVAGVMEKSEIYEKAKRTWWLKWFLVFYKRRMYKEIAERIYRRDTTLLNACNYAKETPLHCAANAGNVHMVSLLVEFAREQDREDPEKLKRVLRAKNKVGETALHEAARSGYSGIVKELLRADETVARLEDVNGISPVEESGAYVNLASLVDENGISPLYLAVLAGWHDVVRQLIVARHPPSYAGPDEQNALHAAVMGHNETITRAILDWDQSLAARIDKAQNTPLHYAALIGNTYAVKELLLKDTGPVYRKNSSGSFPVHLAAEAGNVEVIKELLSMCPDVSDLPDKEERNFLHVAVEKKKIEVILWACQQGNNVKMINAKDKDGNTPLHLAVISSQSEIVALLSQKKRLNPNIRNKAGRTPLDLSTSLLNHQFTYSPNPQSMIHGDLLTRGAIQNPYQPNPSTIVGNPVQPNPSTIVGNPVQPNPSTIVGNPVQPNPSTIVGNPVQPNPSTIVGNPVEMDIGASVDPSRRASVRDTVEKESTEYEKESTKYEDMSKSLATGAGFIASTTFVAIFTVSGQLGDQGYNTGDYHTLDYSITNTKNIFVAFIVADVAAFLCATLSSIGLLYSALSNIQLKRRKLCFKMSTRLLYGAIFLFILTFALGVWFALASSKISTIMITTYIIAISVTVIIILINMANPYFASLYLIYSIKNL